MDSHVLLEKFRALLRSAPGLEGKGNYGQPQFEWLGRAGALVAAWSASDAVFFNVAVDGMTSNFNRVANHGKVFTVLHKAIATLEHQIPNGSGQAFGPGAVYDFFKAMRDLLANAEKSVLIVDPYMDADIFDAYVDSVSSKATVHLLFSKYAESVRLASAKYQTQSARAVSLRKSTLLHDRVIFVDDAQCWVLGASIKDAAVSKHTYLAPLSGDVALDKLAAYQTIWSAATPIQ